MSATVIQHRNRRRKRRSGAATWILRHLGILVVVVAGLVASTWLSIRFAEGPVLTARMPELQAPPPVAAPALSPEQMAEVNATVDLAGPPLPVTRRSRQPARGIPLDAAVDQHGDDYEILSAAELDAISQAHD